MVVDAAGHVHVAATLDNDIYYVTDMTGRWTRHQISSAPAHMRHGDAQIALDDQGFLWIAFAETCRNCLPGFNSDVYLTSNASGAWVEPVRIGDGYAGEGPSLHVRADGVHIADTDINAPAPASLEDIFRPIYVTNMNGSWVVTQVAKKGYTIASYLPPDGPISIIYEKLGGAVFLAVANDAGTAFESTQIGDSPLCDPTAAFGTDGEAHLTWYVPTGPQSDPCHTTGWPGQPMYARTHGGVWSDPVEIPYGLERLAVGGDGAVHGVSAVFDGVATVDLWYVGNPTGSFESRHLASYVFDEELDRAVAVDAQGRPRVFLSTSAGTFYAVGPAG